MPDRHNKSKAGKLQIESLCLLNILERVWKIIPVICTPQFAAYVCICFCITGKKSSYEIKNIKLTVYELFFTGHFRHIIENLDSLIVSIEKCVHAQIVIAGISPLTAGIILVIIFTFLIHCFYFCRSSFIITGSNPHLILYSFFKWSR